MLILGNLPLEQKVKWRIDRANGSSYKRTWYGLEQFLKLIAQSEKPFAESIEFDPGEKGRATLVCTYVNQAGKDDPEVPRETQELDTEALQQSIFLNAAFQALEAREQLLIRKAFENQETRETALLVFSAPAVPGVDPGGITPARYSLAVAAFDLLVMGTETFENYSYVFTRTRTVSRRYPGTLGLDLINTLWTTEQLATYTGNTLLFELPSVDLTPEEVMKNLRGAWRQKVCRVTDIADGSRQMIETWQLAKWSRLLYPDYVALTPA